MDNVSARNFLTEYRLLKRKIYYLHNAYRCVQMALQVVVYAAQECEGEKYVIERAVIDHARRTLKKLPQHNAPHKPQSPAGRLLAPLALPLPLPAHNGSAPRVQAP